VASQLDDIRLALARERNQMAFFGFVQQVSDVGASQSAIACELIDAAAAQIDAGASIAAETHDNLLVVTG
jgi:hypothetical protein